MRISEFYSLSCKDKRYFDYLSSNRRDELMKAALDTACVSLKEGHFVEDVLSSAKTFLQKEYEEVDFSFSWQKEKAVEDDISKISRFLNWLNGVTILETEKLVSLPFKNDILSHTVSLVVQYGDGNYGAVNVFLGKSEKSFHGKSKHTNISYDLYALVSKVALEKHYPGIIISNVYLTHEDDRVGGVLPSFVINNAKNSNVYSLSFKEYYTGGVFNYEEAYRVIAEVVKTPIATNCFECPHKVLCGLKPITPCVAVEEDNVPVASLPVYTDSQRKVIEKMEGAMLVCAGPGSGKTATLVGRIRNLVNNGIEPDYILAITFSREAAGELKGRLSDLSELPYISTIHALCYDILRNNADLVGKELNLLSNDKNYSIIEDMVDVFGSLCGFEDDSRQALLKKLAKKLDKYIRVYQMDAEKFLEEETTLREDFIQFATYYTELLQAKGYITFNEQISLCVELLKNHPDVLSMYSSMYQYIMVDEFQDVDAMQVEFIYMLASHGNIVVVGDDDQNIYAFRGGSHKFMMEFPNHFKNVETVVLKENFRSTKSLVKSAQSLIRANGERIAKDVYSGRNDLGIAPVVVADTSPSFVDSVIASLREKYSYKDMAILSMKNTTLEKYAGSLTAPVVLEKSLLRDDALFLLVHDVMRLQESGMKDNYSLYRVCRLFGANPNYYGGSLYEAILSGEHLKDVFTGDYGFTPNTGLERAFSFLNSVFYQLADVTMTPAFFVQYIAYSVKLEDSPALGCFLNLLEERGINTMSKLKEFVSEFLRFEDDTRIDVSGVDAVRLITNHDSKGREFDVIIMVDDFSSTRTEENRRLFYVAMTRAKNVLYVLYEDGKETLATELLSGKEGCA